MQVACKVSGIKMKEARMIAGPLFCSTSIIAGCGEEHAILLVRFWLWNVWVRRFLFIQGVDNGKAGRPLVGVARTVFARVLRLRCAPLRMTVVVEPPELG